MSDAETDAVPAADTDAHTGTDAHTDAVADPAEVDASALPEPKTDAVLLGAVDLARAALLDITPADTIGEPVGHRALEDHVLSLYFACTLPGYPGWHWTVSLSRIDDDAPAFVLETELTPGEGAMLAPDWVPWSERLADYRAAQELAAAQAAEATADDEDDDLDEDDLDEDDVDELDDLDDEVDEDDLDGDHGDDELDGIDFAQHDDDESEDDDSVSDESDERDK
ncbi:DUF3027 domain-containing protein [Cryobacterium tepidiphilum]|uniref:DUF3027 domain-containing protein n=1 Tax=Cryobacterium tepidiphilum TaxID=2486026 RepID=A0A3M8KV99_9MICO|nr:DUF3027 domain-containing protein [Cryobacterium tepidiphilum]RNE56985.1 DUF3027 domain-containing protein [Cryobacterium tepidiphilum]